MHVWAGIRNNFSNRRKISAQRSQRVPGFQPESESGQYITVGTTGLQPLLIADMLLYITNGNELSIDKSALSTTTSPLTYNSNHVGGFKLQISWVLVSSWTLSVSSR